MILQGEPHAFYLPFQLINPASVASERDLFVGAVNSVIEGFVPTRVQAQLAHRQEPLWRQQRSERVLEERAGLLLDCSLNPLVLAGRSLTDGQVLRHAMDVLLFCRPPSAHVSLGAASGIVDLVAAQKARHVANVWAVRPSLPDWQQLSLYQDAACCLIDVSRKRMVQDASLASVAVEGREVPQNALLALGRRLRQEGSPAFELIQALDQQPMLTLDRAGKVMGCSGRTLQRTLQPLGLSLPRVRLAGHLLRGMRLLVQGGKLTDVAMEAGFFDYPHFARTLLRSSGFSPQTYQRALSWLDVPRLQALY